MKSNKRINVKYVHVTLHKIANEDKDYWIELAKTFRTNVQAVLVGLESNHEEEKGLHAHIVIQFTTKQLLSRKQFVDHFGTDSLHISTPGNKDNLLNVLGYVSKTGNVAQYGTFTYRSIELDNDPEVCRFIYQVKTSDDGLRYFHKVIKEHIKDQNIIKRFAEREDAIGRWLQLHPSLTKALIKLAHSWNLKYRNSRKRGFTFHEFVEDPTKMRKAYEGYLAEFPTIFEEHLPPESTLTLERDYNEHADHDLEVLRKVIVIFQLAIEYGPNRPHKSLNLYLWSKAPSFGKTRLLDFLEDNLMAYRLPNDQYYVDYENGMYSILVSDEAAAFLKTKDYSHLKQAFEGKSVEFNIKGKEKIIKEDNPLMVLAENVPFDEIMKRHYKNVYDRGVMESRVLDLELKSRATLHFFLDRCFVKKVQEMEG